MGNKIGKTSHFWIQVNVWTLKMVGQEVLNILTDAQLSIKSAYTIRNVITCGRDWVRFLL